VGAEGASDRPVAIYGRAQAGTEDLRPHRFRHTFARDLVMNGGQERLAVDREHRYRISDDALMHAIATEQAPDVRWLCGAGQSMAAVGVSLSRHGES
jgi:integrase